MFHDVSCGRTSVTVYQIPTDLPGGDATLAWDVTALVLVGGRDLPARRPSDQVQSAHRGLVWRRDRLGLGERAKRCADG